MAVSCVASQEVVKTFGLMASMIMECQLPAFVAVCVQHDQHGYDEATEESEIPSLVPVTGQQLQAACLQWFVTALALQSVTRWHQHSVLDIQTGDESRWPSVQQLAILAAGSDSETRALAVHAIGYLLLLSRVSALGKQNLDMQRNEDNMQCSSVDEKAEQQLTASGYGQAVLLVSTLQNAAHDSFGYSLLGQAALTALALVASNTGGYEALSSAADLLSNSGWTTMLADRCLARFCHLPLHPDMAQSQSLDNPGAAWLANGLFLLGLLQKRPSWLLKQLAAAWKQGLLRHVLCDEAVRPLRASTDQEQETLVEKCKSNLAITILFELRDCGLIEKQVATPPSESEQKGFFQCAKGGVEGTLGELADLPCLVSADMFLPSVMEPSMMVVSTLEIVVSAVMRR